MKFYVNVDRKIINWKFSNGKIIALTIGHLLKSEFNNDPLKLLQSQVEYRIGWAFDI